MDKKLLINSITLNIPKNIIQFLMGVVFYITFFGLPEAGITIFSLAAFLITYSAVYVYNDITDAKEDAKHCEKKSWKLVACGLITRRQGWTLYILFLVVGLSMSALVNAYFLLMMAALVGLNYLHSSPKFRFKESLRKTAVNMTVIELLKYSVGWFALTGNISNFPFWVALVLSLSYNTSYIIYKAERKKDLVRDNKRFFASMGCILLASYLISFFAYGIPLIMILMLLVPSFALAIFRYISMEYNKLNGTLSIMFTLMFAIFISFLIIINPPVAEANQKIAHEIDAYASTVKEKMPETLVDSMDEIREELDRYEELDEIVDELNDSIVNFTNNSLMP